MMLKSVVILAYLYQVNEGERCLTWLDVAPEYHQVVLDQSPSFSQHNPAMLLRTALKQCIGTDCPAPKMQAKSSINIIPQRWKTK